LSVARLSRPRSPGYRVPATRRSSARDAPGVGPAITRLAKRIKELRLEAELTQEVAAERARLDEKHWQDIEAGRTNPTVATLVGVARSLGVKLGDLFV
jgi:DNA-binding XRE family transcriptional regulator